VGRIGDGWTLARERPDEEVRRAFARVRDHAQRAGRDPDTIGFEGRVHAIGGGTIRRCVEDTERWRDIGATHVVLMTLYLGLFGPAAHLEAMAEYIDGVRRAGFVVEPRD
jgi:alkanesulfonate monooxygenase SsuD/methylene tetrahydromethanopterin reductase-like flavin-dependent oxidoreductase (luciferase family)